MEKEAEDLTNLSREERILVEFISANLDHFSLQDLKNEARKKGYSPDLFDRIYSKINWSVKKKSQKLPTVKNIQGTVDEKIVLVPIEKEKLTNALKESNNRVKNPFVPSNIMVYAFCIILLVTVISSLVNSFSFESFNFQQGTQEVMGESSFFEIGYPWTFISFSFGEESPFKFFFWKFVLNFTIYLFLAYLLDITISNSFRALKNLFKSE